MAPASAPFAGPHDALAALVEALWQRHTASLSPADIGRGAAALRARYLARAGAEPPAQALGSRAKQAAFALLYGPLHFATTAQVVCELQLAPRATVVDVGCGTGVAGAAWALTAAAPRPRLLGLDVSAWALHEAAWTWRTLGLVGRTRRTDLGRPFACPRGAAVVAAFCLNELLPAARQALLDRLFAVHAEGAPVLLLEPIARRMAPFWPALVARAARVGGVAREHRLDVALPERLRTLRRRVSLAHELTVRSLVLGT